MIELLDSRQQWVTRSVPQPFRAATWNSFPAATQERCNVVQHVQAWRDDILDGSRRPLVLYGPPGGGKTFLASLLWKDIAPCVADRLELAAVRQAQTADDICWVTGADIPEIVKRGSDRQAGFRVTQHHLQTAFLAVIDDVDKCPGGGWATPLFKILDTRLWDVRLPTVLTMNLTPRQFVAKYGEHGMPLWSRLQRAGAIVVRVPREQAGSDAD